mgnify:CR=1 FL=1
MLLTLNHSDVLKPAEAFLTSGVLLSSGKLSKILAILSCSADAPETINTDPYGEGWICKMRMDNPGELDVLLDAAAYKSLIEE